MGDPTAYFSDMLWRSDKPAQGDQAAATAEGGRIMSRALYNGDLPAGDKTYLAQLVARRTGMSQPDAEKRVADVFDQAQKAKQQAVDKAKEAADAARKTGVGVALWAFISLLVGAFSASYMAPLVDGSGTKRRYLSRAILSTTLHQTACPSRSSQLEPPLRRLRATGSAPSRYLPRASGGFHLAAALRSPRHFWRAWRPPYVRQKFALSSLRRLQSAGHQVDDVVNLKGLRMKSA